MSLENEIERTKQNLRELEEQKRLKNLDEERLQREAIKLKNNKIFKLLNKNENVAKCDHCGFTFVIEEGHGILHPDTGEPMRCPKCGKGIMKDWHPKVGQKDLDEERLQREIEEDIKYRKNLRTTIRGRRV